MLKLAGIAERDKINKVHHNLHVIIPYHKELKTSVTLEER